MLTKRVGNVEKMLPADWGAEYPNVWLMISVVNQLEADRDIPKLLAIPARARGLSMEPLLGPVDMRRWLPAGRKAIGIDGLPFIAPLWYMTRCEHCGWTGSSELCIEHRYHDDADAACPECKRFMAGNEFPILDWVIAGGESGAGARPLHPDWIRSLRDQCVSAGVAFHFKQFGEFRYYPLNFYSFQHWVNKATS